MCTIGDVLSEVKIKSRKHNNLLYIFSISILICVKNVKITFIQNMYFREGICILGKRGTFFFLRKGRGELTVQ